MSCDHTPYCFVWPFSHSHWTPASSQLAPSALTSLTELLIVWCRSQADHFFFFKKDFQVPVSWICRHGYRGWLDLPCVRYHDKLCRGRVSWAHYYSHSSRVGGWKPTVSVDVFTGRHSEWIRSGTHSALISKSSTPAPLRGNLQRELEKHKSLCWKTLLRAQFQPATRLWLAHLQKVNFFLDPSPFSLRWAQK